MNTTHPMSSEGRDDHPRVKPPTSGRHRGPAVHHGCNPFGSATNGPMRRDYALKRFLQLTAAYRRG